MECRLETITPKKAAEWLRHNARNRPHDVGWSEKLANAMKRGEWKLNGDTIKFNGAKLVDGQHRLHGVCLAGVSIQSYVVRGVQDDAFDTLDQGKRRSVGQMFARDSEKHYNALAAACKFLWAYEHGTCRSATGTRCGDFTPAIAWCVLNSHPGLRDSLSVVQNLGTKSLMGFGIAAALHCLMKQKDAELAETFWANLSSGENISKSQPVYLLRERLLANRAQTNTKMRQNIVAAFSIKAWNATRKGIKLGVLKFLDEEAFPEIQ